jgi:GcrA cell cycle regulator
MSSNSNRWTPEEDAMLAALIGQGKTAAFMAEELGRTRNSVIGRAHRNNLQFKGQLRRKSTATKAEPIAPPVARPVKLNLHAGNIMGEKLSRAQDPEFKHVTPAVSIVPRMVKLIDLEPSDCRYPIGDPKQETFGFCGHPKADGAYCRAHAALCYTAPEIRRKAA